jgi:hypothetical protein
MTNEYRDYETVGLILLEDSLDYHDPDLVAEICDRAGLLEEYAASDGESFESILDRAIEILKEGL